MIEKRIDEIFDIDEEEKTVRISDRAPDELLSARREARQEVEKGAEFSVADIGKYQRPIEYGEGELRVFQTVDATIFSREESDGRTKLISIGVSISGQLNDAQIKQVFAELGATADLTAEEMDESRRFSLAIRSLRQSKSFVDQNTKRLLLSVANLTEALSELDDNSEILEDTIESVEVNLHNLLSSVYTFHETAKSSLSTLEVSREYSYIVQRYRDSVSTALGLRHCIQHNFTLKVVWTGMYSPEHLGFDFNIGVPIADVKNPELYTANHYHDAAGEKYEPMEYFYSGVSGRNIDLESLAMDIRNATQQTYEQLKSDLEADERVENSNVERLEKVKKFHINDWD